MLGIYNLGIDLKALEAFAEGVGTAGLRECFSELRQLIALVSSGHPEQILDPAVQRQSFPHVRSPTLLAVLEKYKESPYRGLPNMKKKTVERLMGALQG